MAFSGIIRSCLRWSIVMNSYLPEEILLLVLHKLPVKSIIRCRAVCIRWDHIICATSFAETHLTYQNTSSNTNRYMMYVDRHICQMVTDCEPIFDLIEHSNLALDDPLKPYLDGVKHSKLYYTPELFATFGTGDLCIYGVCNGLLCLARRFYNVASSIYLWNPICRKVKVLPRPKICIQNKFSWAMTSGISFGYYNGDFKVIVLSPYEDTCPVFIYSLSSNSWNIIHPSFQRIGTIMCFRHSKFVDGTAFTVIAECKVVVCFDVRDETIQVIKFPQEFCPDYNQLTIVTYGGKLALLGCGEKKTYPQNVVAMWILRDRSSSTSPWERKFTIEMQEFTHIHALGFLDDGTYLVRAFNLPERTSKLFSLDMDLAKLTKLRSLPDYIGAGDLPDFHMNIHSSCTESLFLLNEDCLDPLVDVNSSCPSTLFTLHNTLKSAPGVKRVPIFEKFFMYPT